MPQKLRKAKRGVAKRAQELQADPRWEKEGIAMRTVHYV